MSGNSNESGQDPAVSESDLKACAFLESFHPVFSSESLSIKFSSYRIITSNYYRIFTYHIVSLLNFYYIWNMENRIYNFQVTLDWNLIRLISQIDRFDASWSSIEKREGQSLRQLKLIATVRSVGASTRIEGSRMSNEEVEALLSGIDITKLADRDSQEVVGYFEALDIISEAFEDIQISVSTTTIFPR